MLNIKRRRIPYFAKWAILKKPFTTERHYLSDNESIVFDVQVGQEYSNHVEMAGNMMATIISYGNNEDGALRLLRHTVFPTLRMFPNKTHDSLDHNFSGFDIVVNGLTIAEKAIRYVFDGRLLIISEYDGVKIERVFLPSHNQKSLIEQVTVTNLSNDIVQLTIVDNDGERLTKPRHGHQGDVFLLSARCDNYSAIIACGEVATFKMNYSASKGRNEQCVDDDNSLDHRNELFSLLKTNLDIITPNKAINAMIKYAKLRASESIFDTKAGPMHSPGGGGFYAAIWTNDQCEYVNPLFGYLGYQRGIEQSINSYSLYRKYISSEKPLISSIISEGDGIWHGVGDRGDCAMYAYGASRFLLSMSDKTLAKEFLSAIEDCLAYTLSQKTTEGVIASDSDELENRFESGKANLCTSCIAYDALLSTAYLERELGNDSQSQIYLNEASQLKVNIEKYFGSNVEGYDSYRYCVEEDKLRSWIAMPLVVGIFDRAEATHKALLSDKLRVNEGLVTRSGEKTFWDRSTLYTLRGLFNSGYADEGIELLGGYTRARLLGEHIPYPVEAFPEGNQAQLSAESGLYLRVIVEGILGYRPVGFNQFTITPHLPTAWECMTIKRLRVGKNVVDITVRRTCENYDILVSYMSKEQLYHSGDRVTIEI